MSNENSPKKYAPARSPELSPLTQWERLVQVIELLPKVGWFVLAVAAFCVLLPAVKAKFPQTSKAKVLGWEFEFVQEKLVDYNRHVDSVNQATASKALSAFSPADQQTLLHRVKTLSPLLAEHRYKILWVDDHPANNVYAKQILEGIGFTFDEASSTPAALELLDVVQGSSLPPYDILISDVGRDDTIHDVNGLAFVTAAHRRAPAVPLLLFSASYEPGEEGLPSEVFAATNDTRYLMHYVLDAVERGNVPPARQQ